MPDTPPPETPDAPTPSFVTKEELAQTTDAILSRIQGLFEGFNARDRDAAPTPREPEPINLAEIDDAIREGGGADKIARMVEKVASAKVDALRKTAIDPLEAVGVGNMATYARDMVLRDLPERHRRYIKEIDEFMTSMPDKRVLANPEAWRHAVTATIGRHASELEREAVEEAIRKETERVATPQPSAAAYFDDERKQPVPSVKEFAGDEGLIALREKQIDGDTLAKRMGYKDWSDYMRMARDFDSMQQYDVDNPHELYPNTKRGAHARR